MKDKYITISQENFNIIMSRYKDFQDTVNDATTYPVKVFNPLSRKNMSELELIREVSKQLQAKKEEDIKKAAQNAANQEVEKKDVQEEKAEDVKEEKAENVKEEKTKEVKEA